MLVFIVMLKVTMTFTCAHASEEGTGGVLSAANVIGVFAEPSLSLIYYSGGQERTHACHTPPPSPRG